jgi:hypothetical protein
MTRPLYPGNTRQRIAKGYVLANLDAGEAANLAATRCGIHGCTLLTSESQPHCIWLQSPWQWPMTSTVRRGIGLQLSRAARELAAVVQENGAQIYPNAVAWQSSVIQGHTASESTTCNDIHVLEFSNEREALHFYRLFVHCLPEWIAISGRALVQNDTIGRVASHRLANGLGTICPINVLSLAPGQLRKMYHVHRFELAHGSYDEMDVGPGKGAWQIEVRVLDGQALMSTTLRHAWILQALAMRARMTAQLGISVEFPDVVGLREQRSQALIHGVRTEVATISRLPTVVAHSIHQNLESLGDTPTLVDVWHLRMLELAPEFTMLGLGIDELGPLWIVPIIRNLQLEALLHENDMLAALPAVRSACLNGLTGQSRFFDNDLLAESNAIRPHYQQLAAVWKTQFSGEPLHLVESGVETFASPRPIANSEAAPEPDWTGLIEALSSLSPHDAIGHWKAWQQLGLATASTSADTRCIAEQLGLSQFQRLRRLIRVAVWHEVWLAERTLAQDPVWDQIAQFARAQKLSGAIVRGDHLTHSDLTRLVLDIRQLLAADANAIWLRWGTTTEDGDSVNAELLFLGAVASHDKREYA